MIEKIFYKFVTLFRIIFDKKSLYKQTALYKIDQILNKYLPPNLVILEAGAHKGTDTVIMKAIWPKSVVYAFEPVPDLFKELESKTKRYKNVFRYNVGLGNQTTKAKIYLSEGASDASSSLFKPKEHLQLFPDVKFEKELMVDLITLDSWAFSNKINKVDLFWLDMQGYELQALKAGTKILKSAIAVYMEVNFRESYEGLPLYDEVKEWMRLQDFEVVYEDKEQYMGNVLFLNKKFKNKN